MTETSRHFPSIYLPTLDGWRAVAILLVICNHDTPFKLGIFSTLWLHNNGAIGVDIFFALSGLLICSRMLVEESVYGSIHVTSFYLRRLFRIQPAALFYLFVLSMLMIFGVLERTPVAVVSAMLGVRNYLPLHSANNPWYTEHFWSLAVEEQFYLLWPAFFILFRRHRIRALLIASVLLQGWRSVVFHFQLFYDGRDKNGHIDMRALGMLAGCLFAVALTRSEFRRTFIQYANSALVRGLFLVCFVAVPYIHSSLVYVVLCFGYIAVIGSTMLRPHHLLSRFLECKPVRFIGRISYSLYLWQMLFFVHNKPVPHPNSRFLEHIQESGWRYVALIVASIASYYLVEKPMIKFGHRLTKRKAKEASPLVASNA